MSTIDLGPVGRDSAFRYRVAVKRIVPGKPRAPTSFVFFSPNVPRR